MSLDDDDVEYVKRQYLRCTPMAKLVFPVPSQTGPAQPTRAEPSCSTGAVVDATDKTVWDMQGTPIPVINLDANSLIKGNLKLPMAPESSVEEEIVDYPINRTYNAPSQDALREEISEIKAEIQSILLKKSAGLDDGGAEMELEDLEKKMKEKESELRVKKQNAKRQRKLRDRRKELATVAKERDDSEMKKKLEVLEQRLKRKENELRVKKKNAMRVKRWRDRRRGLAGATEGKQKKNDKESETRVKEKNALRLRKYRARRREMLAKAMIENPDLATRLGMREELERPRLEKDQPELLKAIAELVPFGASARDRRRLIVLRSCRTLPDLHKELEKIGFTISKNGTYLRLVQKKTTTPEGKKRVMTVPVRLVCPQADLHKAHMDQNFCKATIQGVETLASILGPDQVIFISQDDKARVSLGITGLDKQAPVLMHLDYQNRLPDHDWVVAQRHKLVPSVYAYIVIKPHCMGQPDAVTYSGPTYIAIRSGKHSSSTVSAHAADFEKILSVQCFHDLMANKEGELKPVVIISVDGGPEENPRCPKVIAHAIDHFQKHNLDAMFIFTNAPGTSAYNRVEKRMAPLTKELAGVVLEHQHFGSHLNVDGKTVDPQLEIQNLAHAGGVLADIWNGLVLDGHKVSAEYIQPGETLSVPALPPADWYARHVRESQYLLQISNENSGQLMNYETQRRIFESTIEDARSMKYPPRLSYRIAFLRALIEKSENNGEEELYDKLYETLAKYMMLSDEGNTTHYRQYLFKHEDGPDRLILQESKNLISDGTTGLCTWQASFPLIEWCVANKSRIKNKLVLELGSGVGLVGLSVIRTCSPKRYTFSDCHPAVLDTIVKNVRLNFGKTEETSSDDVRTVAWNEESYKMIYRTTDVRIKFLNWSLMSESDVEADGTNPEVVLASDVIYDERIHGDFIETLGVLIRRSNPLVIVATTVRNEETLAAFFKKLDICGLSYADEPVPKPTLFLQLDDTPVRIFKISDKY